MADENDNISINTSVDDIAGNQSPDNELSVKSRAKSNLS